MNKTITIILAAALVMGSCATVPVTGRKQVLLVNDSEVLSASLTEYQSYMKTATRSTNAQWTAQVERVGRNIANATEAYLRQTGQSGEIRNFAWEFNLVKNNELNAFCMPGGKIVVYEGLMKLVSSDDELAVVLGHEVAHAVAKHSNERMSQQVLSQYGANVLGSVLSNKSAAIQNVAGKVYGLGTQYGVTLPFSRKHESEADYIGLIFMRLAGYDPNVALTFWQKMASMSQGSTPELMSTHPSDSKRISQIKKELPGVMSKYKPLSGTQQATPARQDVETIHFPF